MENKPKFKVGDKIVVKSDAPITEDRIKKGVHTIVECNKMYLRLTTGKADVYYVTDKDKMGLWEKYIRKPTETEMILYG